MEEGEIEQWYEDEKQKAMDDYLKNLESSKNRDEPERAFNDKMDELTKKYNQLMEDKISNKGSRLRDFTDVLIGKLNFIKRKWTANSRSS